MFVYWGFVVVVWFGVGVFFFGWLVGLIVCIQLYMTKIKKKSAPVASSSPNHSGQLRMQEGLFAV